MEESFELLKLADLYIIEHLKSLCEKSLFRYINVENVVSFYQIAEQYNGPELKEFCFKFMLKHYEALVIKEGGEPIPSELLVELKKYLKL